MINESEVWDLARPRGDRVWGYPLYSEQEEETEGGIVLVKTATPRKVQQTLKVIRVGEGVKDIKEGDICILDSNGGGEVVQLTDSEGNLHNIFVVHEKWISLVLG